MAVIVEFSVHISGNIRKDVEDYQTRFWEEFLTVLKSRAIRAGRRAVGIDSGNLAEGRSRVGRTEDGLVTLYFDRSLFPSLRDIARWRWRRGAAPHPSPQRALDAVVKRNLSRWVKAAEAEANRRIN